MRVPRRRSCAESAWLKRALGWETGELERLLRAARSVNAHSAWTRSLVAGRCPTAASAEVVHYGGGAAGLEAGARVPAEPPGEPYILCAARVAKHKGLDILLMSFAQLVSEGETAHLVLCGEDHSDGLLERLIPLLGLQGRAHYLGRQPRARVRALMEGCLFLAAPSRKEGMGMAIVEAMQAGKPVVASRVGGIPELVRDGSEGLLVPAQDVKALADAMRRLLREPELRARLGKAALSRSAEVGWDAALDAYRRVYLDLGAADRGRTALLVTGHLADDTVRSMLENAAGGLERRGLSVVVCAWRSRWSEPFRSEELGRACYRLGLPCMRWALLDDLVMLLQLLWVRRRERVGLWHCFILNYVRLRGLSWFTRLARTGPVVTLA